MLRRFVILAGVFAVVAVTACSPKQDSGPDWDAFVQQVIDGMFTARPDFAVNAGRHEFDGQLPDWSAAGLAAYDSALADWRTRALAFDAAALDSTQRYQRDYVVARIDRDLWWLRVADGPHRNPAYYADALDPDAYLSRPYAPLEQRMRAYIKYARAVVPAAAQIRANLRTPMPRTFIDRASGAFGGFAAFFSSDVPTVFASVADTALQREFRQANDSAIAAMRELDVWVVAQRATQTEDFALGADRFRQMLFDIERVDTPLDELERIGRADLKRNQDALRTACATFAPGATVKECMARSQALKPKENTVDAARRQLTTLKQFLLDSGVVTIPGPEEALVNASPAYMRWNFAYIMIPGPYETNMPSTYYVAPPEPTWTAKERAEYTPGESNLLFTSVHEVWPGHFLQFLHANRSPFTFGRAFVGYAFAEGWAHYTEEMMWDAGLGGGDVETHIGQLSNALLRNVRYLAAIGLHTKGMSVAEAEQMFIDEGFQDQATARQQAARGTFDPEYLDYTMGKLMIMKLREDWTASRGGRAAWKSFHDAFLSFGGPPIPLVRRAMVGATGSLF